MNILEKLIKDGICDNKFRARHIADNLKLYELKTDEERLSRARLYRDWRNSQIFGRDTKPCCEKAIAGEPVPQLALIEEAMHSEGQ